MNPNIMECDDHKLKLLLAADEQAVEHDPWMQHVEHCSHCQSRLRELAAQADDWQKAAEVLAADDDDVPYFGRDHDAPSSWNESMVKQLLEPPSHPEMLGRLGRYEMERMIGCGGMGIVFKAFDTELNRVVAVKLLAPYLAARGSARKRFAREARAAAGVRDDHVVPIFNVESEHEPPFLVMQYVAGGSLQEKLDRDGPLEVAEVLRIGLQTAKGLAAAHAQGLIHRDVKPSNILLDEGVERALLTDFGLARAEDDACLTRSGFHPGTPHYMSPEQVRGEAIDGRSDLFSLGCVLYALCTGHSPFRAETSYAVMRRITDESPRPIREQSANIPEWLEAIVMKLLAKSRDDRFASAREVAELLEDCLAHVHQPAATPLPVGVQALAAHAVSASTESLQANRLKARQQPIPPIGKFIAAAVFAFALVFAGVVIALELNKGTLTIQSDVDGIQVRITRGEEIVDDLKVTKGEKSIRVAAGQYAVEVIGDTDGLTVENGKVTLRRADTEVVKIIRNTHDDNQLTYTDPNAAIQAYRSNSSDSLSETIDQFNFLRTKDPLNDQPPLTKDELIACASWNIERNHELTESLKAALNKIAKQHQWPEGWRIDGSYVDLPPDATPVRAYRISLVHAATGEVFTIRERCIEPPSTYVKRVLNLSREGTQHLTMAIKRFNARYNQANGYKQPPLTENEVVAAIIHHQTKRDEDDVSDTLFEKFQQIAKTGYLPEGATFDVIPTFGVEGGSTYGIWSVRIKMFQDEAGKEGWTYAFVIRDQFVSVKHGDAGEIHWGQPSESGLQAGVRLSPPLLSYELGQKIDVQIFYRNILSKPISAHVPNFCRYEVAVLDSNGAKMEVFDLEEPIVVGGAISRQIGNEPISSHGRSLAFAATSLAKDKREEYRAKTGASILIFVEPGKPYRLQFTLSSLADSAAERLKTGEVEIAVEKANVWYGIE